MLTKEPVKRVIIYFVCDLASYDVQILSSDNGYLPVSSLIVDSNHDLANLLLVFDGRIDLVVDRIVDEGQVG